MRHRHGMGGGGGGHHHGGHHHGGGGGGGWRGPWGWGPSQVIYTDCVRDPEDLRRCLPPEAYAGFGGVGEGVSNLLVLGGVLLGVMLLTRKKR